LDEEAGGAILAEKGDSESAGRKKGERKSKISTQGAQFHRAESRLAKGRRAISVRVRRCAQEAWRRKKRHKSIPLAQK